MPGLFKIDAGRRVTARRVGDAATQVAQNHAFAPPIAGVIVPCLIIFGLAAIPYLDVNPRGSGFYTLGQRCSATVVFLFGFLQLWILMVLIGTFFRGS